MVTRPVFLQLIYFYLNFGGFVVDPALNSRSSATQVTSGSYSFLVIWSLDLIVNEIRNVMIE